MARFRAEGEFSSEESGPRQAMSCESNSYAKSLSTAAPRHSMFKLGPVTQEASICLRCQYRLGIRRASHPTIPHRSTTPQQRSHFASSRNLRHEQAILSNDGTLDEDVIVPIRKYDPFASRWQGNTILRPCPGTKHSPRGKKDTLTFNALGEPAEVLVLDDGGVPRPSRSDDIELRIKGPAKNLKEKALSSSDMLEEIDAERGLVDTDQVFENIEIVKESWMARLKNDSRLCSTSEYAELASGLANGFTTRQLAVYLARLGAGKPKDPLNLRCEFSSRIYARSAWIPGTTFPHRSRAPRLVEVGKANNSSTLLISGRTDTQLSIKSKLVENIVQQCWRFSVRQDDSTEGELDIRTQATALDLIMNHKRGILKQISETYGAKIEALPQDQVIRLTSDHDTCLDILKIITFILDNIRTSEIELPIPLRRRLKTSLYAEPDTSLLRQVEQLTNTVIRTESATKGQEYLHVYYLGPDDGDVQDVRRLISQVVRPKPTDEGWLDWCGTLKPSATIPVPVDVGSGLSLIHRNRPWLRWCSPDMREIREHNIERRRPTLRDPLYNNTRAIGTLNKFFALPRRHHELLLEANSYWQSNVAHWDSAMFGQVVFPMAAAKESAAIKAKWNGVRGTQISGKLGRLPREFVSSIAGVFRLLQPLGSITSNPTAVEYLQIHLTPSLRSNNLLVPIEVLPNLEIRITLDNTTKSTSVEYVRLLHSKHLDIMLPLNTVDLRFVRNSCVYWRTKGICDPRIQQFIQDSNLDVWGTDRLRTPTELAFEIPWHAMRPHEALSKIEKPDPILADYTFSSLEHHSGLHMPFSKIEEWSTVTYTSIEAGKLGGRRDELTLTSPQGHGTTPANDEGLNATTQTTIVDKSSSASPIAKANALISAIENHPGFVDSLAKAFSYGAKKDRARQVRKAKSALGRTLEARRLTPSRIRSSILKEVKADRAVEEISTPK